MPTYKPLVLSAGTRLVSTTKVNVVEDASRPLVEPAKDTRTFDEGYQAGSKKVRQDLDKVLKGKDAEIAALKAELNKIRTELAGGISTFLSELENQVLDEAVELSFAAAEAIVRREVERESPVQETLREALQYLSHLNEVKLMLSPSDFKLLAGIAGAVPSGIALVQDAQLQPGEIFLESPQGFLDGKIATRLDELKVIFREKLRQLNQGDSDAANA